MAPILFGIDKFANVRTKTDLDPANLSSQFKRHHPGSASNRMAPWSGLSFEIVGRPSSSCSPPRLGGLLVGRAVAGRHQSSNLLLVGGYGDIGPARLRLLLGALSLSAGDAYALARVWRSDLA